MNKLKMGWRESDSSNITHGDRESFFRAASELSTGCVVLASINPSLRLLFLLTNLDTSWSPNFNPFKWMAAFSLFSKSYKCQSDDLRLACVPKLQRRRHMTALVGLVYA
jgi:hypothetical protein